MILSIKWFRDLDPLTVRKMSLKFKRTVVYQGKVLLNYREISQKIMFILSGSVILYVYNPEKRERYKFETLYAGSSVNIVSTILG